MENITQNPLDGKTVEELQEIAKGLGIKDAHKMKKPETLIAAIAEHQPYKASAEGDETQSADNDSPADQKPPVNPGASSGEPPNGEPATNDESTAKKPNPYTGPKPSIGRMVHYVNPHSRHRPAIIVEVWQPECADAERANDVALQVFTNGEYQVNLQHVHYATYSEDAEIGTWHWPERVD